MGALRELLARFNIAVDTSPLVAANTAIDATKNALGFVATHLKGVMGLLGVGGFAGALVATGSQLGTVSQRLGMTAQAVQEWSYATSLSIDEFTIAAKFLENALDGAAAGGGGAAKVFARLGVSAKDAHGKTRTFGDVLPDIAEAFAKIDDPSKQTAIALDLFGRSGIQMVPALKKGRKGIEELRAAFVANGGGFSDAAVAAAKKVSKANKDLKLQFSSLKGRIAEAVLPSLAALVERLGKTTGPILELTRNTHVFELAAVAAFAMAAKAALPMIAAWAPAILVVGGLVLAFDDLWTAIKGGDSIVGRFFDSFMGANTIPKTFDAITKAVTWSTRALSDYIEMASYAMSLDFKSAGRLFNERQARTDASNKAEANQANFESDVRSGVAQGPTRKELGAPSAGDEAYDQTAKYQREKREFTGNIAAASVAKAEREATQAPLASVFALPPGGEFRNNPYRNLGPSGVASPFAKPKEQPAPVAPFVPQGGPTVARGLWLSSPPPATPAPIIPPAPVDRTVPGAPAPQPAAAPITNVTVAPVTNNTIHTTDLRAMAAQQRQIAQTVVDSTVRDAMAAVRQR